MSGHTRVSRTAFQASQRITTDGFSMADADIGQAPPACEHDGCPASGFRTPREYHRHLENAHDGQRAAQNEAAVGAPVGGEAVDSEVDA